MPPGVFLPGGPCNLVHPIKVRLRQLDAAATGPVDPDYRTTAGDPVYTEPRILTCQASVDKKDEFFQRPSGQGQNANGHLTFRRVDLDREAGRDFLLHQGDIIISLYVGMPHELQVSWHVLEVRPRGHMGGRPLLYFAFYKSIFSQAESAVMPQP